MKFLEKGWEEEERVIETVVESQERKWIERQI